jgi:hypothetical protein
MDYIIFNQPGGFPLTTNILDKVQEFHKAKINALAAMAGNRAIISGCQEVGNKVLGGDIVIDGEMYGLIEGIKQEYITIKEDKQTVEFENGENKVTVVYRYAVFGTGTQNYKWADFKRVPPLIELAAQVTQQQEDIKLLKAVAAPTIQGDGVHFFDNIAALVPPGYDEVPESEYKGRMLIHINRNDERFDEVGKKGGKPEHNQTPEEVAPHDHWVYGEDNNATVTNKPEQDELAQINNPDSGRAWRRRKTGKTGEGKAMPIMNPYRVVLFIKWVGIGNGING